MSDALTPIKRHGGARRGAGRPRRSEVYKSVIRAAEDKIGDKLPLILEDLFRLAQGQYSETRLESEPAGHLFRDDYEHYNMETPTGTQQRYRKIKVPIYPDLPPDQMVVTKHVETNFSPDRAACIYLINRILGPPQAQSEEDLSFSRALLADQQAAANVFLFQAQFMEAQRLRTVQEMEMNTKSYVTEEDELSRIQTLVKALNDPLLHMTPEIAAGFGMNPDQLESLKAHLGRSQGDILREVIGGEKADDMEADEEEEEDEE